MNEYATSGGRTKGAEGGRRVRTFSLNPWMTLLVALRGLRGLFRAAQISSTLPIAMGSTRASTRVSRSSKKGCGTLYSPTLSSQRPLLIIWSLSFHIQ